MNILRHYSSAHDPRLRPYQSIRFEPGRREHVRLFNNSYHSLNTGVQVPDIDRVLIRYWTQYTFWTNCSFTRLELPGNFEMSTRYLRFVRLGPKRSGGSCVSSNIFCFFFLLYLCFRKYSNSDVQLSITLLITWFFFLFQKVALIKLKTL